MAGWGLMDIFGDVLQRPTQVPYCRDMPPRSEPVTSSRFERRIPGGRLDMIFQVAFGSDAAAARALRVSRMTVWRWRHDRAPLPRRVVESLPDLIQSKVVEAHLAQSELGYFLALPPNPPRALSGCCADRQRKRENIR
jgi:hypothetical protein